MTDFVRYRSDEEDSGRWLGFPFRTGDIVISTRSKSGTTWMQMIVALLVFRTPRLPAPLTELSPWLDWLIRPRAEVVDQLDRQQHRRFIKTHTPLDGVPIDPRVHYIVVARHPLDMAVSLFHQGENIDRERLRELTGAVPGPRAERPGPHDWLVRWAASTADPRAAMDSLPGVLWHLSDAWQRRHHPNIQLIHYADLKADLPGQMRAIAARLGLPAPDDELVEAATFGAMRARAAELAPNPLGVLKDSQVFFRQGRSGAGRELLSSEELDRYHRRAAELAPPDLLDWLHR
ncbi:sulfotransferase domain-containing protein [Actinoplanes sp. N902-109]|uniref:sulfotransferase domain-containing protein n=1 Tax=Actinoplanes sp. (strain N902-109) TaxID=649831 RepID=UPI000329480D|nr:sulfotransferase domain-containing protein [Actinoplanes sp. N902-109]AGL19543.1 glycolipid sulfotransferase [Actinoplanes sp. N902-109]